MSGLKRFFVDKINGDSATLNNDEFKHAVFVMRLKVGDRIIVSESTEYDYEAEIVEIGKKDLQLKVLSKTPNDRESKTDVRLICGYLKGDKTELAVQKAVELGIKSIVLFSSDFSSAYMSENKLERLNKVSAEAAKQCGRSIAPKVFYVDNFKDALLSGNDYKNKLFACEFADKNECDFESISGSTAIVVGSEGGFSETEAKTAREFGYTFVSLGKRILRAETASITLCGIIMHRLGELG